MCTWKKDFNRRVAVLLKASAQASKAAPAPPKDTPLCCQYHSGRSLLDPPLSPRPSRPYSPRPHTYTSAANASGSATTVSEDMAPGEGQVVESSAGNLGYISGIWHSTRRAVQLHGELTPGFTPSPHLQQHHLRKRNSNFAALYDDIAQA
ncbi:MAG: hypothetical protein FRX49_01763 [Trebouxia sp. A1-2]|nr:MAG: hypothetical protein FRX49_01763 [Trebouxia sp. A1-2]